MTFSATHKLVTYLFASLGIAALTLGSTLSTRFLIGIGVAVLLTVFAEGETIRQRAYGRVWNAIAVIALGVQLVRVVYGAPLLNAGIEYAAVLQVVKLATRREASDHQQVIMLGFLHLVAATVLSAGLEYAIVFLGFVIVTPWMLALTHIRSQIENQYADNVGNALSSKTLTGPRFFAGTALLSLPLFFLTATFFFAFPRVGLGYLAGLKTRTQTMVGFGGDVQLGGFGTIRDDATVAVRVRLDKSIKDRPTSLAIRLRGTSFDHYDRGKWSRTTTRSREISQSQGMYPLFPVDKDSTETKLQIIVEPMDEPVLFLPSGTYALGLEPRLKSNREVFTTLRFGVGIDIRYTDNISGPMAYAAYVDSNNDSYRESVSTQMLTRYSAMPSGYQRVAGLAEAVTTGAKSPQESARAIESYLRSGGGYSYTLDQPDTGDKDPLHVFLFESKKGHCEYFSTAMAVMLRARGIPSRNVTGFLGGDYNPYGDFYAVRNSNAHSWVEAFINGRWVTFDPTPSGSQIAAAPNGMMVKLQRLLDAARIRWAEYVVEYSIRDQSKALSWIIDKYKTMRAKRATPAETGAKREGLNGFLKSIKFENKWIVVLAVIAVLVAMAFAFRRRQQNVEFRDFTDDQIRAKKLYAKLERALHKHGTPRPVNVTPQELVLQLSPETIDVGKVKKITEVCSAARFGQASLDESTYRSLCDEVRKIAA